MKRDSLLRDVIRIQTKKKKIIHIFAPFVRWMCVCLRLNNFHIVCNTHRQSLYFASLQKGYWLCFLMGNMIILKLCVNRIMRIAEQWIRIYYYYEQKTGLNLVIDLVRWFHIVHRVSTVICAKWHDYISKTINSPKQKPKMTDHICDYGLYWMIKRLNNNI